MDPFFLALAFIVVGYYFFSSVLVRRVKDAFITHLIAVTNHATAMQNAAVANHIAFHLVADKAKQDEEFFTEKNFTKNELAMLNALFAMKAS